MLSRNKLLSITTVLTMVLLGGSLPAAGPAEAAAQVTNPCARLTAGQTKYTSRGAARVTFATTTIRATSTALVTSCVRSGNTYLQEWQTRGYVGINGFKPPGVASGHTKYEFSPTGSFSVTEGFGSYNPGTRLPFRILNRNSRWGGGGQWAGNYNTYFESAAHVWPDEDMWSLVTRGDYRQGAVINYNRPPDSAIKYGAGFAIFLHSNPVPTAGCISLPEATVSRFLRSAAAGDRIIMGAVDDVFTPYSSNPFGPITAKYAGVGGQVAMGNPVTSQVYGMRDGGSFQNFAKGRIMWSARTGARTVKWPIVGTYNAYRAEGSELGYPIEDHRVGYPNGGIVQHFQKGAIVYSPASGARVSIGPIRAMWGQTGWERGRLGYPLNNIYKNAAGTSIQDYQRGTITWSAAAGAKVFYR